MPLGETTRKQWDCCASAEVHGLWRTLIKNLVASVYSSNQIVFSDPRKPVLPYRVCSWLRDIVHPNHFGQWSPSQNQPPTAANTVPVPNTMLGPEDTETRVKGGYSKRLVKTPTVNKFNHIIFLDDAFLKSQKRMPTDAMFASLLHLLDLIYHSYSYKTKGKITSLWNTEVGHQGLL